MMSHAAHRNVVDNNSNVILDISSYLTSKNYNINGNTNTNKENLADNNNSGNASVSSDSYATSDNGSMFYNSNNNNDNDNNKNNDKKGDANDADEGALVIAKAESDAVFRIRLIVMVVLLLSTVGVSLIVFFFMHNAEVDEFHSQFSDDSSKVLNAIGTSFNLMRSAADEFTADLVLYAKESTETFIVQKKSNNNNTITNITVQGWPFVTMPDFAVRASKSNTLSNAITFSIYPYVNASTKTAWEQYSVQNDGWVDEAIEVQRTDPGFHGAIVKDWYNSDVIYADIPPNTTTGPYLPSWQTYPVVATYPPYNWDAWNSEFHEPMVAMLKSKQMVFSLTSNLNITDPKTDVNLNWVRGYVGNNTDDTNDPAEPYVSVCYPILDTASKLQNTREYKSNNKESKLVAAMSLTIFWRELLKNILPQESDGIIVVIKNECDQAFTYRIKGLYTVFLGVGDLHDKNYESFGISASLADIHTFASNGNSYTGTPLNSDFCPYSIHVYGSSIMEDQYITMRPIIFTVVVVLIFLSTSAVFFLYDCLVEKRQQKVMKTAMQTSAIVSSLFPSVVRDRLFPKETAKETKREKGLSGFLTPKLKLQSFLQDGVVNKATPEELDETTSPPIAELFPETTVLFADISGFTAWSSVREPSQVFTLLEAVYRAFDTIAKQRGVFKVETIGDSYVAVAGLPKPRPDHATAMARFARDCREKMIEVTQKLEITLGPDTGDLKLRFGLNSGPVTAGVLRGERSRFQLFGDTVNTASRMESTGVAGKIQVSQTTADELKLAGKEHWLVAREDLVVAKGKGSMQTYWVEPKSSTGTASLSSCPSSDVSAIDGGSRHVKLDSRMKRLVDWNVDLLLRQLKQVVTHRACAKRVPHVTTRITGSAAAAILGQGKDKDKNRSNIHGVQYKGTVLDEVKEIIELPKFDASFIDVKFAEVELSTDVKDQLRDFVMAIAAMYRGNAFHNFEHASHVTMSVSKLLSRIVVPDKLTAEDLGKDIKLAFATLHDHTYGITSDPLTLFACFFAALIHDVDHPGVPNMQLVKENAPLAVAYKGKSMAEQNSVDLAWELFLDDKFVDFRAALCCNTDEMKRFRQLVVNSVMATDIMDQDLKSLRNARWQKAFAESAINGATESEYDRTNRKATIVIEHLLQASDVVHTMQHWHIYRKWNERLFAEMHAAYVAGRAEKNPAEFWYQGEIGFFDYYIIPLAKKLHECGVFGVSSDEYLNYAIKNREEWEAQGKEVVESMIEKLEK